MKKDKFDRILHDLKKLALLNKKIQKKRDNICADVDDFFKLTNMLVAGLDQLFNHIQNGISDE